jgi:Protein adenylyltransferase SelO
MTNTHKVEPGYCCLPVSSFVERRLYRVKNAHVGWVNAKAEPADLLEIGSWSGHIEGVVTALDEVDSIRSKSERYGGVGISRNGGGVRCATVGDFSLKGIGTCALAGKGTDYWHSYGGLTLREAIKETIWGEVFSQALPHGAIRSVGILIVPGEVPLKYPDANGKNSTHRAILVRKNFLRLGHFLPTHFFSPSRSFQLDNCSDFERTMTACSALTNLLVASSREENNALAVFLNNFVSKFAQQIARMRAMRIIHGSISPSNISLNAELLDFGMSTSVASLGPLVTARDNPNSWEQQLPVLHGIEVLLTCLVNYGLLNKGEKDCLSKQLADTYRTSFIAAIQVDFLRLSGFLVQELEALSEFEKTELFDFLFLVASKGQSPMKILCACPNYQPFQQTKTGAFDFFEMIKILTSADLALTSKLINLTNLGFETEKASRTIELFESVHTRNANGTTQRVFTNRNALRLNQPISRLFGFNLNAEIDAEISAGKTCSVVIEQVLASVQPKISVVESGTITFFNFEDKLETLDFDSRASSYQPRNVSRNLFATNTASAQI